MRELRACPKGYSLDLDKTVSPEQTVTQARARLGELGGVLEETRRIDTGRLGVPVYLSVCGPRAKSVMPTRKQMGKGASPAQAEASALMELVERFSFFSFWADEDNFVPATYDEAETLWPGQVLPLARLLQAVHEELDEAAARRTLNLTRWRWREAMDVLTGERVRVPLDFFKKLNEFNGSSAGNALEEAILQGACELVERHVSALVDRERPVLPLLDPASFDDPVLRRLHDRFTSKGVQVWLQDMTLGLGVPVVSALAFDPATFPGLSEIVFTAGSAASPTKAAIRALTEVAQLAGDFETGSNYEASGLPKFKSVEDAAWLTQGPTVPLSSLPNLERPDIRDELDLLCRALDERGVRLYAVETTRPELELAAAYCLAPGFLFRERSPQASLGLFVGRILAEESPPLEALTGLEELAEVYPDAHFLPFFQGLLALRLDDAQEAAGRFAQAEPLQPDDENRGLAAFYQAHALTRLDRRAEALPCLDRAIVLSPEVKEYYNLRGVTLFKAGDYEAASRDFQKALDLDSGSAMDLANLGLCQDRLGRTQAAMDYLEHALRLDPAIDFARRRLEELRAAG